MCTGATRGFATLKFSTSPKMFGSFDAKVVMAVIKIIRGIVSFRRKIG